jgi:hypothetical protein
LNANVPFIAPLALKQDTTEKLSPDVVRGFEKEYYNFERMPSMRLGSIHPKSAIKANPSAEPQNIGLVVRFSKGKLGELALDSFGEVPRANTAAVCPF